MVSGSPESRLHFLLLADVWFANPCAVLWHLLRLQLLWVGFASSCWAGLQLGSAAPSGS